ncbi:cation transporter dimerization domain-containing protein [Desnuesiella massiliensis]|uniref:cation transporter dimerization domain-containing protein n=1 Tax=Desnuesiella massiliensis TaxID=1650662 RepID=UPI0006E34AFA
MFLKINCFICVIFLTVFDLHVLVIPDMKVSEAHALQHKIENVLKSKFGSQTSTIIHVEPYESI